MAKTKGAGSGTEVWNRFGFGGKEGKDIDKSHAVVSGQNKILRQYCESQDTFSMTAF